MLKNNNGPAVEGGAAHTLDTRQKCGIIRM